MIARPLIVADIGYVLRKPEIPSLISSRRQGVPRRLVF
jgi:hypothetical protein